MNTDHRDIAAEAADHITKAYSEAKGGMFNDLEPMKAIILAAIEKAYRQGLNEGFGKGKQSGLRAANEEIAGLKLQVAGYQEMADSQFNTAEKLRAELKSLRAAQASETICITCGKPKPPNWTGECSECEQKALARFAAQGKPTMNKDIAAEAAGGITQCLNRVLSKFETVDPKDLQIIQESLLTIILAAIETTVGSLACAGAAVNRTMAGGSGGSEPAQEADKRYTEAWNDGVMWERNRRKPAQASEPPYDPEHPEEGCLDTWSNLTKPKREVKQNEQSS